jgi:ElaB/YqjD/DUF883 family membrane-anchored ribosome-binding protein
MAAAFFYWREAMTRRNETTGAEKAANAGESITDSIRSVAHTVSDTAGSAAAAMGHGYDEARQMAHDTVNHARARVRSWEHNLETAVRENPKTALLIAAVAGAVVCAWWKRK